MIHKGTLKLNKEEQQSNRFMGIPFTDEYKYLGIWIDKNLNLKKQLRATEDKMKKGQKMINICKWKKLN